MALTKAKLIADGVIVAANLHSSHGITSANIGENTNLYFTNARARSAISVSGNALSYNSSTGVITSNFEESPTFTGTVTVSGDLLNISGATPELKLTDSDDSNYALYSYTDGDLLISTNHGNESGAADIIRFANNGATERMRIHADGNVTIGNTTSVQPLTVAGNVLFRTTTADSFENRFQFIVGGAGDAGNFYVYNADETATVRLNGNGASYINGGAFLIGQTSTVSTHLLTVNGKIGGPTFSDSYLQFTGGNVLLKANDDIKLGYNQNVIVKQSGNVGIGTTSPSHNLEISGVGGDGTPLLQFTGSASATFNWISSAIHANLASGETSVHLFGQAESSKNSGYIGYLYSSSGSDNNAVTIGHFAANHLVNILANGKVGIGTTGPDRLLDVSGTGNVYTKVQSTNSTAAGIELKTAGGSTENWLIQADESVDGLAIYDLGRTAYRMVIDDGGNVGIGATSPTQKLEVAGNIAIHNSSNAPYIDFVESGATSDSKARIAMDQIDTNSGELIFSTEGGGTLSTALTLDSNQNTIVSGPFWIQEYIYHHGDADTYIRALSNEWVLRTGGSDRLTISDSNTYFTNTSVGIGTTSPDRSLDVEGTGMAIFGTGDYTELMLRGQVEGTGTVRNVGSWHWSIRGDIGGDNDDLKLVRFVTGSYVGIAMQVQNSTGDIFFGNTVVNPATGFSNQRGLGYDQSTGNLEAASTSGTAMTIGRNESSDGQILQLRKESNIKHSFGSTTSYLLGNVGIGTTSPQSKLHISTSTTNAPIRLQNDNGSGSTANYVLQTDSSGLGNNGFGIYDVAQSAYRFVINGSGKVGIGTTNPQNQFVIKEGSNVDMEFGSESSGCFIQAYNRTTSAWGYLRFIAGGGEQMRIHTNGNVGIGNTSPTYKLSVNHGASAGGGVTTVANFSAGTGSSSGDGAQINLNNWGDNYGGFIRTVNTQGTPNYLNPKMEFGLNYNNYLPADMITRMTILGNGNVGIGTGSPPESLEISGNMAIRDTHKIYFNHNTNTNRYIGASSANDLDIAADDDINYRSNYNRFFNGSTEFARLSSSTNSWIATGSNGKLGINKTNPAYNLDVTGSIFCTSSYVRASTAPDVWYSNNNNGTYTQTVLYMNQSNSSNTDLNGYFFERGRISNSATAEIRRWVVGARGGQKQMVLDGPGTLTVAGDVVAYGSPSDKTLKKDIKPIENALSKIQDLEGVTFTWKDPSITNIVNDIGFIAQDVKKVLPTLVRENENGKLSMRHQGVIPILVEAIKELTARVEKLENKNCACKE